MVWGLSDCQAEQPHLTCFTAETPSEALGPVPSSGAITTRPSAASIRAASPSASRPGPFEVDQSAGDIQVDVRSIWQRDAWAPGLETGAPECGRLLLNPDRAVVATRPRRLERACPNRADRVMCASW